jgi:hypothetical protein
VLLQARLGLGFLFAFGVKVKTVGAILICILVLFSLVATIAVAQGRTVACGGFPVTVATEPIGTDFVIRNGLTGFVYDLRQDQILRGG